ncbi:GNAT family N-acetyltransferase [Paenibacillus sp. sptzw28]|uniref:GNAT family N-acetyltransferase n=1 Tax=Paenibacillus sp. sptzw28 TaxID=715179 RepID=UPI001C6E8E83|nr:GNAT family N-acetyltransferase [Paenibacillus sp. sptzw28]QYR21306.1 GNAT family N-acetyltransferase [Paenibacillus sp. sptzw28]
MKIQAKTLYVLNEENRIVGINEPEQAGAPLLFIGRTKKSIEFYYNHNLPEHIVNVLNRILSESINVMELCRVLEKYRKITSIWMGPAFVCPSNDSRQNIANNAIVMTEKNSHFLSKYFPALIPEIELRSPVVGLIVDGQAVSVCSCARKSEAAAEAGLLTIEQYRGNGYAERVVAEWIHQVRQGGLIPLYSTSWDNMSSQRIAQKLNMVQYGMDFSITAEQSFEAKRRPYDN